MKIKAILLLGICACLWNCKNNGYNVYTELEKFDTSLDSLISEETFNSRQYTIWGDTLKNNPKEIIQTCYLRMGNDSILIGANGGVYKFENNKFSIREFEDVLGNKYVSKYIYFENQIDNEYIDKLKRKYADTDTVIVACVEKYNLQGKIIKSLEAYDFIKRSIANNRKEKYDVRKLEIYQYDNEGNCKSWRREYFGTKYDADSIKAVPIASLNCRPAYEKDRDYSYTYDEFGNWIVKKKRKGFRYDAATDSYIEYDDENDSSTEYDVYYREIKY